VLDTQGLVTKEIMLHVDGESSTTISSDCQHIALRHEKGTTVWYIESGELSQYNEIGDSRVVAVSNNGGLVATRKGFDFLRVWDLDSERLLLETDLPSSRHFEFSADGKDLITDHGRLHIATSTWTTSGSTSPSSFGKDVGFPDFLGRPEWVQFDDEDLLWIPDEYRADHSSYDARGGTVALGQNDGSVLIMEISDPW
jgi:hypothetical protein